MQLSHRKEVEATRNGKVEWGKRKDFPCKVVRVFDLEFFLCLMSKFFLYLICISFEFSAHCALISSQVNKNM